MREQYEPIVFHDLRDTFGTVAVPVWPLSDVQAYMGHAHISTTMIYVHHVPRHDAEDRFSRFVEEQVAAQPTELSWGPMDEERNESTPEEQPAASSGREQDAHPESIELSEGRKGLVVMPEMSLSPADVQDAAGGLPAPSEQQSTPAAGEPSTEGGSAGDDS